MVDCIALGGSRGTFRARRKEEAGKVIFELRTKSVSVKGSGKGIQWTWALRG